MPSDDLVAQLGRIKTELDGMIRLMLDKEDHVDVASAIFAASAQVCKAEVLLMMKTLSEQQLKELGIKIPID
jgi:hypothetical protein